MLLGGLGERGLAFALRVLTRIDASLNVGIVLRRLGLAGVKGEDGRGAGQHQRDRRGTFHLDSLPASARRGPTIIDLVTIMTL